MKKLNIVLLASNPDLYSNKRIIEAGTNRGHNMRFINIKQCFMDITAKEPSVYYRGTKLEDIDAVIPRIRPAITYYGTAVVRQFESMNIFCLNKSLPIVKSRDKLRTLQILAQKKIEMPKTGFANSPLDTKNIIKLLGGAPLIIKLLESTQGTGIVLAETNKAAESVIGAFKSLKANILVQEFIEESNGKDLRLFVIGDRVKAAMQRSAMEGEFRANVHLGGITEKVKITPEERAIAIKAAKVMGLDVAGVDIIRSDTGPMVLEINSSPGLEGIEKITGKDIAAMMIENIEKNHKGTPSRI